MKERIPLTSPEVEGFVAASQKGDSDAFGKLYDLFVNSIYRYIFYRVGAKEAEDLTELVFLKTWENLKQYRSGPQHFSSWIFRIAHNVVVDYYRSRREEEELTENFEDMREEAQSTLRAHRRFDHEAIVSAIKKLKDSYRQILILKYINDFSNEEIKEILGRSGAALRILQFRALRSLKRILEEEGYLASEPRRQFIKKTVT